MSGWVVVKFVSDDSVETVPYKWLIDEGADKFCWWPPTNLSLRKVSLAIKQQIPQKSTWNKFAVELLSKHIYVSFSDANKKANKAKYLTDLSSEENNKDNENRRKRKRPQRYDDSSTSEDESNHSILEDFSQTKYPTPPPSSTQNINTNDINMLEEAVDEMVSELPELQTKVGANLNSSRTLTPTATILTIPSSVSRASTSGALEAHSSPSTSTNLINRSKAEDINDKILRQLIVINSRLRDHGELLQLLLKEHTNKTPEIGNAVEHHIYDFPVRNENDLANLEELLSNKNNFLKVVKDISKVGGNNAKELIRRMLIKVISDSVASQYSWVGAKGKKKFSLLKLAQAVKEAIKVSSSFYTTEKDIENVIGIWLSKAPKRLKKKRENQENADL